MKQPSQLIYLYCYLNRFEGQFRDFGSFLLSSQIASQLEHFPIHRMDDWNDRSCNQLKHRKKRGIIESVECQTIITSGIDTQVPLLALSNFKLSKDKVWHQPFTMISKLIIQNKTKKSTRKGMSDGRPPTPPCCITQKLLWAFLLFPAEIIVLLYKTPSANTTNKTITLLLFGT